MRFRRNIQHCLWPILTSALGLRGSVGAIPIKLSEVNENCHFHGPEEDNHYEFLSDKDTRCRSNKADSVRGVQQPSPTIYARQATRTVGVDTSNSHGRVGGNPAQIAFITLGLIVFIVILACVAMRYYFKKKRIASHHPQWPPMDAPGDERQQLIDLIRIGIIDSRGAPIHVLNWVLYGPDAPWPPPDNVTQLWASRRRARRRRRRRAQGEGTRSNAHSGSGTRSRSRRPRPTSMEELAPLPPYVKEADEDQNHFPIPEYQQPPEFPDSVPPSRAQATVAPTDSSVAPEDSMQRRSLHSRN